MLYSFAASVPSKFGNILNDANDPMGITKESIDEVCLGNNGAVYVTNTVYPPTSFVSVLYPAIINETLKIMRWAVEKNNYKVYLNSLNVPGGYSFFIPKNDAFLSYIDPVSYAGSMAVLYRFHYDSSLSNPVWASRYYYDMENGEIKDSIDEIRNNDYVMQRKLKEVLDNVPIVTDLPGMNAKDAEGLVCAWPMTIYGPASMSKETAEQINAACAGIADKPDYMARIKALGSSNTYVKYSYDEINALTKVADEQVKAVFDAFNKK